MGQRGTAVVHNTIEYHPQDTGTESERGGDVQAGPVGGAENRPFGIGELGRTGIDWPKGQARGSVIANLDVRQSRGSRVTYCQPYRVVTGGNIHAKDCCVPVAVWYCMTASQPHVYAGAGILREHPPDARLITKGQAIASGWVVVGEDVRLVRPVGDEAAGGAEIQPTHSDGWR